MRIGTCVNLHTMDDIEEKLATLQREGFDNCQLICWETKLFTDENARIIKELLAKYGITVSGFWCGWEGPCVWNFYEGQTTIGLVPPEHQEMRIRNLCAGADFALKLGVTDVITHMGFIPENPYDPLFIPFCNAVRRVAEHLKAQGQWLLFETGQETPVAMLRTFETVGCDNLGINLDTANLILYGKANPVDALDVFGKYVRNLHAKDGNYPVNGHDLGWECKLGQGKVDFPALFRKLHDLGFDSWVTIEREISGEQQLLDIRESRTYLQSIIDSL